MFSAVTKDGENFAALVCGLPASPPCAPSFDLVPFLPLPTPLLRVALFLSPFSCYPLSLRICFPLLFVFLNFLPSCSVFAARACLPPRGRYGPLPTLEMLLGPAKSCPAPKSVPKCLSAQVPKNVPVLRPSAHVPKCPSVPLARCPSAPVQPKSVPYVPECTSAQEVPKYVPKRRSPAGCGEIACPGPMGPGEPCLAWTSGGGLYMRVVFFLTGGF